MEVCWKISGRVQRVGYRNWAVKKAHETGNLSGYICNFFDNTVLLYIRGNEQAIVNFKNLAYKGPWLARVDNIEEYPEGKTYFPLICDGIFKRI